MVDSRKIGICIECGQHEDVEAEIIAKESIKEFLIAMGHVTKEKRETTPILREKIHVNEIYYSKTDLFVLSREFYNFEPLKKGEKIGTDGTEEVFALYDCYLMFAHDRHRAGEEVFLLGVNKSSSV